MDGYLTNNNVIGNDIVGQALIDLDLGFFAAPATSAQENSNQQGIDTEAFNGFLNGKNILNVSFKTETFFLQSQVLQLPPLFHQ